MLATMRADAGGTAPTLVRSAAMKTRWAMYGLAVPAAATVALLLPLAASAEQAIWELGTLTCSLAPEAKQSPSEPGQGRTALCHFRPRDRGAEETYVGTFQFIGQDKATGSRTIMMIVKAPVSKKIGVALLDQAYSADASTGVGKQAPLVGSKDSSLVLQLASDGSGSPSMALGQAPPTIMLADLKLVASPA
jgi:Protein of unknown function (DUF992)